MLVFKKDDTKKEKFIIIGLWGIALYHIVAASMVIIENIVLSSFNVSSLIIALFFFALGMGLLLKKKWAVQVATLIYFIVFYMSIGMILLYFFDGMSSEDDIVMNLIVLCGSGLFYFILFHEKTSRIYDVDFTVVLKIQKVISWTLGLGLIGFILSYVYTELFEEGVYRGFAVVYGSIFFIGIGFLIGLVKAFRMKAK